MLGNHVHQYLTSVRLQSSCSQHHDPPFCARRPPTNSASSPCGTPAVAVARARARRMRPRTSLLLLGAAAASSHLKPDYQKTFSSASQALRSHLLSDYDFTSPPVSERAESYTKAGTTIELQIKFFKVEVRAQPRHSRGTVACHCDQPMPMQCHPTNASREAQSPAIVTNPCQSSVIQPERIVSAAGVARRWLDAAQGVAADAVDRRAARVGSG